MNRTVLIYFKRYDDLFVYVLDYTKTNEKGIEVYGEIINGLFTSQYYTKVELYHLLKDIEYNYITVYGNEIDKDVDN